MYKIFETYVLRTPLLTVDFFLELTGNSNVSDDQLKVVFSDSTIKESIYLASPVLYKEIEKWSEGKKLDVKGKIRNSFLKYLTRISSRPTPFGLFSGCSIGNFLNENNIVRDNSLNKRHTRLDMNLTGLIIKHILEVPSIKEHLIFSPNSSLFVLGNLIRFIEYKYNNNSVLVNKLIEVESSDYLKKIICFSQNGKNIVQLSNQLITKDIGFEEAREYIIELIDSQVLVSELEQTVSGTENFDHLLSFLYRIGDKSSMHEDLKLIKLKLTELDNDTLNYKDVYQEILNLLERLNISMNEKYIFQTDLIIGNKYNTLSKDIANMVQEGLTIMNKIDALKNKNIDLLDFKNAFYERYETEEIPLALALDKEIGLGYPINSDKGDLNPLINDIVFNSSINPEISSNWSPFDLLLFNKVIEAEKKGARVIEIKEEEIPFSDANWANLPDTFSTIAQIMVVENENMIHLNAFVGSSAGNLFGRFCQGDPNINKFVKEIIRVEDDLNPNKILAEIVHLPEDRLGNILMRPSFRNYEIPFLSRSTKVNEQQIPIDDILISVRNNRIFLRSKKMNKELCPKLTTAHNYKQSTLPVYRFLCEMQFIDKRKFLRFDWNNVMNNFLTYFPRVTYKKIILSTAKWKINRDKIKNLLKINDDQSFLEKIENFMAQNMIPQLVYLVDGDNKLLINMHNFSSVKMFLGLVKSKDSFFLEEFLFLENAICTNTKGKSYANEFIFSFYKN